MSEEKKIYTPYLKWYQTDSNININIQLGNAIDSKITLNNNYFFFSGNVQDKYYEINFELFDILKDNTLSYYISEKDIKITIEKESQEKWESLAKIKNLYKNNIQINWDLWIDSDDDEDIGEENNMPFDMQQMMANMGGMGNEGNNMPFDMEQMQNMMANMGGMENMFGNSDAEDIEDAEVPSDAEDGEVPSDAEDAEDAEVPSDAEDAEVPSDAEDAEVPSDAEDGEDNIFKDTEDSDLENQINNVLNDNNNDELICELCE
jgi:hypothetical protein